MEYHRIVPHKPKLTSVVMFTNVSYHKSAINPIHHDFSWLKSPFSHDFTMIFPWFSHVCRSVTSSENRWSLSCRRGKMADRGFLGNWARSGCERRAVLAIEDVCKYEVLEYLHVWDWHNDLFYVHIYIQYNTIIYIYYITCIYIYLYIYINIYSYMYIIYYLLN